MASSISMLSQALSRWVIRGNAFGGLAQLDSPVLDARRMAELLGKHGFEVISCDGKGAVASTSTAVGSLMRER